MRKNNSVTNKEQMIRFLNELKFLKENHWNRCEYCHVKFQGIEGEPFCTDKCNFRFQERAN